MNISFKANQYQQLSLEGSCICASERVRKTIEKSWAKDFADIVYPAINEERFSVLYSDNAFSRPNTPVNVIVDALMLKGKLCKHCAHQRHQSALPADMA